MQTILHENRHTLRLALPIMTGQLGQMLLGLTDTLMIGRLGADELASAAFVNVLIHLVLVVGIGLSAAVSVQVSHAHGARDPEGCASALRHGAWASGGGGVLSLAFLLSLTPVLHWFGQSERVVELTPPYLRWAALSMVFYMPSMVIKSFAESRHHPWPVFGIMLGGVLLNVLLNRILIFGGAGVPALRLEGAGIATCIARLVTLVVLWTYLRASRTLADGVPRRWMDPPAPGHVRELIRIAAPITGQMLLEFGAFALSALLIGHFGTVPLAAHQIAITCAATTYMIPLGVSMAVTIRVGHSLGSGRRERSRRIVVGAQGMGLLVMSLFAGIYLYFGRDIAAAFTRDPELAVLAARLLGITGVFQVFDGIQIISMGGLRAFKDVNHPTAILFVSYWMLALPMGATLGFGAAMGARGLWTGLAAGLAVAAVALSLRLGRHLR